MRRIIFTLIVVCFPYILVAQTDSLSIVDKFSSMESSKAKLIEGGRYLILKNLEANNVNVVKETMDYLISNVEDEQHLALWTNERMMLYFWIGDYSKILNWIQKQDSYVREKEITLSYIPKDNLIGQKLEKLIDFEYDLIINDIKSQYVFSDTRNTLISSLDQLLDVYYPELLEKPSKSGSESWLLGFNLVSGANFYSGKISNYVDLSSVFFNIAFGAYYKKMCFVLNYTGIEATPFKDVCLKNGECVWPEGETAIISMITPTFGIAAYEYKNILITPFAGLSMNIATSKQEESSFNGLGTSLTPVLGLALDYVIGKPISDGCVMFGVNATYMPKLITTQERMLTGNILMLGLSVKAYYR